MAYCPYCGADNGDATICQKCGYNSGAINAGPEYSQGPPPQYQAPPPGYAYQGPGYYPRGGQSEGLFTAAFVFMIICTIILACCTFGIALAWGIPMSVHASRIRKGLKPNTIGFGVCSLLFVGIVPGVLLLVAPKDQ